MVFAIAFWPWVIATKSERENKTLMNHEKIHLEQQKELFVIPFYILYVLSSAYCLVRYWSIEAAYKMNIFEGEAFFEEVSPTYLEVRPSFYWFKNRKAYKNYGKKKVVSGIADRLAATFVILFVGFLLGVIVVGNLFRDCING